MKTKRIISIVTACILVCTAAFSVHAMEQENLPQNTLSVSYDTLDLAEYAEQVAVLVNRERTANGLQPVKVSPQLGEAANIRASELKENFSHTRPDGTSCFTAMDERGITYRSAAENIAYGQRSPEAVMNAWMNSSGHRANILSGNMEYIGVGAVYRDGVYYWVQLFAASDSLSDGAYLPDAENTATTSASTEPATTALTTTTSQAATTEQSVTTESITTVQTTTKPAVTTASETTETTKTTTQTTATSHKPITTTQTTFCKPITTEQTTSACKPVTTTECAVIVTRPVISLPSSGECPTIGGGAVIIISPQR